MEDKWDCRDRFVLSLFNNNFLSTVLVVVVAEKNWLPGNMFYFAAQTDTGITLQSSINKASLFKNYDDAEVLADEIESKMEECVAYVIPVARFAAGAFPELGVR